MKFAIRQATLRRTSPEHGSRRPRAFGYCRALRRIEQALRRSHFPRGGVAQALRDFALTSMREKNIQTAWLTVNQLNDRANAFYKKSGFAEIAVKKYQVGDVVDDDYLRTRAVTSVEKS